AVAGPAARSGSRLVRAPGGGLVLFGGMGSAGRLADTWTWNGTAWSLQSPATVPPARSEHALAFDPASGRTVLYGGTAFAVSPASGALADAWQWDGVDWSPLPPPQVAPLELPQLAHDGQRLLLCGRDGGLGAAVAVHARTAAGWQLLHHDAPLADVFQPCYTLDLVRQELVRFGGRDLYGSAHRDDTWVWNLGWQLRTPAVRPPARRGAPMAFDPLRGVAVLFGGANTGGVLGDTWTWDGTVWVQQTPASSPPPRVYGAIAFDPLRGTVVLFGGQGAPGYLTDTWEWNGTTWAPVPTAVQPPGATAVSMAFDAARLVLALYVATAGQPGQLWELGAAGWQLAHAAGPSYGPLVYDPGAGNLVAMSPYGPADYVQGAWVLRAMATHSFVVSDPVRGGILSVPSTGALVQLATLQPASAVAYGQGCGPLGEVTVGANRSPALGTSVAVRVRTLASGTPTFLFYGAFDQNVPLGGGCTSWVGGLIIGLGAVAPAHGHAEFGLAVPVAPSLLGAAVFAQPVTLYPNGLGFGNGVRLTVGW
ncbi:MAG: kelch repeat-containing protein, partial [Planctomycetota bacterium]